MKFEIDDQTLSDLAIFQNAGSGRTIFNIFNKAVTYGGADKLKEFFDNPLTEGSLVQQRFDAIQYLQHTDMGLVFDKGVIDFIEYYLKKGNKPVNVSRIRSIEKWIAYKLKGDSDYYIIHRGIGYTMDILKSLQSFIQNNNIDELPLLLGQIYNHIKAIITDKDFEQVQRLSAQKRLGAISTARADHLFRYLGYDRLKALLDMVYQLDVLITAGTVSKKEGFTFPVINEDKEQKLILRHAFHPFVDKPVPNNIEFNSEKNICFVTGANMAGKSTFLKSAGVCVFLSQIGFPVPAAYMETSVFKGLITTINLADSISQGNSHFYSEVLRVKYVAQKMSQSQQILVIFDELFRGTNVKDAYDASLAIIRAFAKVRKSFFIISTHIVEVAHELAAIPNIEFKFMETIFTDGVPQYSYKLQNGITEERLGMWIVNKEGIVDIINKVTEAE